MGVSDRNRVISNSHIDAIVVTNIYIIIVEFTCL